MEEKNFLEKMHVISVTGIIIKNGKYLITKRSPNKKVLPGRWTVPGGNLDLEDYKNLPKDVGNYWYNIFEKVLRREIKEEVGLEIKNIKYLTSMTFVRPDNLPALIVSLYADYESGEVNINEESVDFKWVNLDESKKYDLIEGIYEELAMLDNVLKGKYQEEWSK